MLAIVSTDIDEIMDNSSEDYKRKQKAYEKLRAGSLWWKDWTAANIWTSAFFYPLTNEHDPAVATFDQLMSFVKNPKSAHGQLVGKANGLAQKLKFFHLDCQTVHLLDDFYNLMQTTLRRN